MSPIDAADQFAALAEDYCRLIERHTELSRETLLSEVHRRLPAIYAAALLLPGSIPHDVEVDAGEGDDEDMEFDWSLDRRDPDRLTHDDWMPLFTSLGTQLGDRERYQHVYDPHAPSGKMSTGNLADDLADIYSDLRDGLVKWRRGERERAPSVWRGLFETHWGPHLIDALNAIHWLAAYYDHPWPSAAHRAPVRARYVHTNLIARDWRALADFYVRVFACVLVPPERDYRGAALDAGTGLTGAHLTGAHLRLPGAGDDGPTLEIYQYDALVARPTPAINRAGFGHIAFEVDDVAMALAEVRAHGGGAVGELVTLATATGARVTWVYATDPEGNVVELQAWS